MLDRGDLLLLDPHSSAETIATTPGETTMTSSVVGLGGIGGMSEVIALSRAIIMRSGEKASIAAVKAAVAVGKTERWRGKGKRRETAGAEHRRAAHADEGNASFSDETVEDSEEYGSKGVKKEGQMLEQEQQRQPQHLKHKPKKMQSQRVRKRQQKRRNSTEKEPCEASFANGERNVWIVKPADGSKGKGK